MTTHKFAVCSDLSWELVCNSDTLVVLNLYPDGVATSHDDELVGRWRLGDRDVLFEVNHRAFTYDSLSKSYFNAYTPDAAFGYHVVLRSALDRWSREYSRRFEDPAYIRALLHYSLDIGVGVHDACINLQQLGNMESVPHLIKGPPHRTPGAEKDGVVCTVAHCRDALVRITHQDLGWFADAWEAWWTARAAAAP